MRFVYGKCYMNSWAESGPNQSTHTFRWIRFYLLRLFQWIFFFPKWMAIATLPFFSEQIVGAYVKFQFGMKEPKRYKRPTSHFILKWWIWNGKIQNKRAKRIQGSLALAKALKFTLEINWGMRGKKKLREYMCTFHMSRICIFHFTLVCHVKK